jgi:hypothetical protein
MTGHAARFVICVRNDGYPASLELHKVYRVVRDEDAERDGDLRVVDESDEDYLYPTEFFVPVEVPTGSMAALERSYVGR